MSQTRKVAVYFVASPLQYLAAKRIAQHFESGARQVLVWYKPGLESIVEATEWDACAYMPWPRLEPLPGMFGRHRRLRENIRLVTGLVGNCDDLVIHSAVFDTEAINYFLHALPAKTGAIRMRARILPDGLISTRRYPLSASKRLAQYLRKLRRCLAPELNYVCFKGDRIGSDAPFCDRIYVVPSLPHQYPVEKVCELPPLVDAARSVEEKNRTEGSRALVIGQPLSTFGLLAQSEVTSLTQTIQAWLNAQGIKHVEYKAHPKDALHELHCAAYEAVSPKVPLETHMAAHHYDIVVGVRSSALLFARQIYPSSVRVVAFGWDKVRFKSKQEEEDMRKVFSDCGVELL